MFALIVGATFLLAGVGVLLVVRNEAQRHDRSIDTTIATAEAASRATDRVLIDSAGLLGLIAGSPVISEATPEQVQTVLEAVDTATAGFTGGVAWLDVDGELLAGTGAAAGDVGDDRSDDPAVRSVIDDGILLFVGEAFHAGGVEDPVVPVAAPVHAGGDEVAGVVIGYFDAGRLARYLSGFRAGGSNIVVLDGGGHVVAVDNQPGDLRSTDGDPVVADLEQGETHAVGVTDPVGRSGRIVAAAPTTVGGWLVLISRPTSEVFGPDRADTRVELSALLVAVLVALGVGFVGTRRLNEALARVEAAEAADRVDSERASAIRLALADVAGAGSRRDAGDAVVLAGIGALGARASAMVLRSDADPDVIELIAAEGYPVTLVDDYHRRPFDNRTPAARVMATGRPLYLGRDDLAAEFPDVAGALLATGDRSWASVPLRSSRQVIGVVGFSFADESALMPDRQLEMERYVGDVGDALGPVHTREVEHEFALALQRNLLPDHLPHRPDLQVQAEYLPANDILEVGGDWYDVVERADGGVMVVVGDVVGHGVPAIAAMGQLSSVCRVLAEDAGPADLVGYLERSAHTVRQAAGTTAVCVFVDEARTKACYAIAGHPRPMLFQDGVVVELTEAASLPLAYDTVERHEAEVALHPPATLVLFSDGLLERRDESYTSRVAELAEIIRTTPTQDLKQTILTRLVRDDARDDTVLVIVHLPAAR